MRPVLHFQMTAVLDLAEHAVNAPDHTGPVADEPAGPALQLVVDDGICLRSNGLPPPPIVGCAAVHVARAVYAEGYPVGTPWLERVLATGSEQSFIVGLPLCDEYRLLDQLRDTARPWVHHGHRSPVPRRTARRRRPAHRVDDRRS